MSVLIVVVILLCGLALYCITASASRMSRMEERWLHPPSETNKKKTDAKEADA